MATFLAYLNHIWHVASLHPEDGHEWQIQEQSASPLDWFRLRPQSGTNISLGYLQRPI